MAVHGHDDCHAGLERAFFGTREILAAQEIYRALLPFLRCFHPAVRRGAALGNAGASGMDWSIFLYVDLGVQSFRRLDLLVDGGGYLQLRARQAAVWIHRG